MDFLKNHLECILRKKEIFEPIWFVSNLSRGVHYEDNLEYTFEKILLNSFGYFQKFS